jgi:hypothetical protein
MASRIFRYAVDADAGTGESNGGGQGEDFLVYQTATATPLHL